MGVKEEQDGSFTPARIENPDKILKDFYNLLNDPQKVSVNLIKEDDVKVINEETYLSYRQQFKGSRPSHPFLDLEKEDFLIRIGAAKKDKDMIGLTKEGLLFFGKESVRPEQLCF